MGATQCTNDDLKLNISKTKEMIIDFRKNTAHQPTIIHGKEVARVDHYKYLGVTIQDDLK